MPGIGGGGGGPLLEAELEEARVGCALLPGRRWGGKNLCLSPSLWPPPEAAGELSAAVGKGTCAGALCPFQGI